MAQRVREVMTSGTVKTVTPDSSLSQAAMLMRDADVGDVIVADGESIRGIVTDRDLVVRGIAEGLDGSDPVARVASVEVMTIEADDPIDRAVAMMRSQAIRRLPVVEEGRLVGIVSLGDLAVQEDPGSALAGISAAPPNA